MQTVLETLADNIQLIYRKALDADQSLAGLQQSGKGKFQNVFADDSGFSVQSKRFMPYVEELAKQVAGLNGASQQQMAEALPDLVKKIELMLKTLSRFQESLKD